ncbi:MAG: hypothetical protein OXC08_05175 [Thiotrichales bacterium]|nr:hypothetical protein [Thiotrichales bacterium]
MMTQALSDSPHALPRIGVERQARMAAVILTSQSTIAQAGHARSGGKQTEGIQSATWGRQRRGRGWLTRVLAQLDQIDHEVKEEGYPTIGDTAKRNARSLLFMTNSFPVEPTVYPSMDGEIALYFKAPSAAAALLIQLDNDGGAGCYWSSGTQSEHKRFEDGSNLPEEFVWKQLRLLGGAPVSQTIG